MKRSTFRKSSLISSVALLLVAIVALSGATFAWFSAGKSTKAEGINLTAASVSGLYIAKSTATDMTTIADDAWSSSVNFLHSKGSMTPTSSNFSNKLDATFVKVETDMANGAYNAATDENGDPLFPITEATKNSDYICEDIWVKGEGTTATTLTATLTVGGTTKGYERVAVWDVQGNKWVGSTIFGGKSVAEYNPLTLNGIDTSTKLSTSAFSATPINITTDWVPNQGRHFVIYCWFEGQDTTCYNTNSGANLTFEMVFSLPTDQG